MSAANGAEVTYHFTGSTTDFRGWSGWMVPEDAPLGGVGVLADSTVTIGTPFSAALSYSTMGGPVLWEIKVGELDIHGFNAALVYPPTNNHQSHEAPSLSYNLQPIDCTFGDFAVTFNNQSGRGLIGLIAANDQSMPASLLSMKWSGAINGLRTRIDGVIVQSVPDDGGNSALMLVLASSAPLLIVTGRYRAAHGIPKR
jgi:hypothetical protein